MEQLAMGKAAHLMMVPYPAQGHVIPMLELAHTLAKHNIRITFVNTEFIHDRIVNSSSGEDDDNSNGRIRFLSVSDGLKYEERDDTEKFMETMWTVIPQKIEELIQEEEEKYTCLVFDQLIAGVQRVAEKTGIQSAVFLSIPAATLVLQFKIPKLIEDGIIDNQGTPLQTEAIQLAPKMPIMNPSDFFWHRITILQRLLFDIIRQDGEFIKRADRVICNSTYDLEQGAVTLAPQIVPIGPLLARNRQGNSAGHFWKEESDSLEWLDQQPPCSVIYVAFGSIAILGNAQFQELALGLEQANRPFLWVVRLDHKVEKQEFPEGYLERVSSRGRIIGWAPQQKVLSHPSTACFVSHCGWNSTVESLSNGVPMLCWPHFADQFINQSYICDIWRVGLQFERDHGGNIASEEFKKKIDLLFGDNEVKERALHLKETIESSAREGGDSYKNLSNFISWLEE